MCSLMGEKMTPGEMASRALQRFYFPLGKYASVRPTPYTQTILTVYRFTFSTNNFWLLCVQRFLETLLCRFKSGGGQPATEHQFVWSERTFTAGPNKLTALLPLKGTVQPKIKNACFSS